MNSSTTYRIKIMRLLVVIFAILISLRLYYWQIIQGPTLAKQAQLQRQEIVSLSSERGSIFDAAGDVLVGSKTLYHLYLYRPQLTITEDKLVDSLVATLGLTNEYLKSRLDSGSNWISLKHYLTEDQKKKLDALSISGLGYEEEFSRYYPDASLSAQILGFVGSDQAGIAQGYFGLEGYFDRQLRGREGKVLAEKDAFGKPIIIGKYDLTKSITGRSITTSIDRKIQYMVEKKLKEGMDLYQARAARAIIMETKTGRILSMASFPNYDPTHFIDFESTTYKNPNIADLFEPGSIFKVIVLASALDDKIIEPDTKCDICSGPVNIGEYSIKTWNEKYYPDSTVTDTIVHSDNTGMVFIARKLGKDKFLNYLQKFGFGQKTGIELQEEVSGIKRSPDDFKEIDLATNSFGQGIAVTSIQMVTAVNVIANGGIYVSPTIIDKITSDDKKLDLVRKPTQRIISQEADKKAIDIMVTAVEKGEAKWAKPKNLVVAGKTGTAQIPIQGHYDPEKTIASFVGFFPAYDPKYTILVSLTEPKTSPWGSETAAPLWFKIASQLQLQN